MKSIKVIVLDADNCIFLNEATREGSEEVKDLAWFDVFPEYAKETLNPVLEDAKNKIAGGKGDRNDIARRVLEHFGFPENQLADEVVRRCARFDEIVQKHILDIPITDAVRTVIADLSARYALYINTATPRDSLVQTLRAVNLDHFKGVYGRPGTKIGNLQEIARIEGVMPNEMLFVGDTEGDREAAEMVGCRFVGMHTKRNPLWHVSQVSPVIGSLTELGDILDAKNMRS